ncbi:MAG: acyltransferase [Alphaproteobacteria bacterium]|nr:acyltransferase [Alphaproteobacteria bacterium]
MTTSTSPEVFKLANAQPEGHLVKHYPFINGLRALAVAPVILFHFRPEWCPGGYAGVDVFFVISGFLITGLLVNMLDRNAFTLADFYERRARRILPALFMTCMMCVAMAWAGFMPEDFKQFSHTLIGISLFATNVSFYEDVGYFAGPALIKPLLHTWSLAVEEQFYILFPVFLLAFHRWTANRQKMTIGVAALFGLSLTLSLTLTAANPDASFYFLHTRAWELLAGALVFLVLQEVPIGRPAAEALSVAGIALLAFSYLAYDRDTPFPGGAAIVPCFGTALLIWSNLQTPTAIGRALSYRPVIAVGLVSYGLYLFHWPLWVFARYYLDRNLSTPETALVLIATAALSVLSYVFVEMPVRSRKLFPSRRAIFTASLGALLLVAAIGVAGQQTDGFPSRFSGSVLQYLTEDPRPPEECHFTRKGKAERQSWCKIGDAHGRKNAFILWGDSHAQRSSVGLGVVASSHQQAGWVVSSAGCPPLLKLERIGSEKYRCPEVNDKVLDFIRREGIKKVILVGRWDLVMPAEEGGIEDIRSVNGPTARLVTENGKELLGIEAFDAAFRNTIAALSNLGAEVWVMKQVPAHRIYLSTALAKAAYWGRDTAALNRPLDEVLLRRAPIENVFEKARDLPATFIDPVETFCPDGKVCLTSANMRALYHDGTHLSNYGALWSKEIWEPVVGR